jgi:hypothetical protein
MQSLWFISGALPGKPWSLSPIYFVLLLFLFLFFFCSEIFVKTGADIDQLEPVISSCTRPVGCRYYYDHFPFRWRLSCAVHFDTREKVSDSQCAGEWWRVVRPTTIDGSRDVYRHQRAVAWNHTALVFHIDIISRQKMRMAEKRRIIPNKNLPSHQPQCDWHLFLFFSFEQKDLLRRDWGLFLNIFLSHLFSCFLSRLRDLTKNKEKS